MENKPDKLYDQLTLFDIISGSEASDSLSTDSIKEIIHALEEMRIKAEEKGRRLQIQKEKAELERKEKLEREKRATHIDEVTSMDLPMDWENVFDSDVRVRGVHTDSIPDAFLMSLSNLGVVNIEYISSISGANCKTVITTLKGSIYQNPDTWNECFYKGWETADEYLSGNLMLKWRTAKKANEEYMGYFSHNVDAIERVLPPAVASSDIYITLGSPWVPADVIDDFIVYLFGEYKSRNYYYEIKPFELKTLHDELTGSWKIPFKSRYDHTVKVRQTYGTEKLEALYILERTLNMKSVVVTDEISCSTNSSGKKRVINKAETVAALEKQQKLIKAFQKWVWAEPKRKARLGEIFESKFSCVRRRVFDGSFLSLPSLSTAVTLFPYQKDAVARIIFSGNTLLAHDVGSGKTYIMIAAGQELRRMGLSKKNMYVVPNNIVGQWENIFLTMYPEAKLLTVNPAMFVPSRREEVLARIKDEDFDGIIIAYSCFEQIPISKEYYVEEMKEKEAILSKLAEQKGKATSRLKRKQEALKKALSEAVLAINDMYDTVYFDELGITRLFVDEAHNFKNVPIETKLDKVLGINSSGSKKCQDMMDKVHIVQKINGGKGVVFATGTPITNSITDAFIMQQYLQSGELAMLDLQSFDSWIGMFAEQVTEFEIDVDTSTYRLATRFAKFHNIPELTALLSSIADFHRLDESSKIPKTDGYCDALISKTSEFQEYLEDISRRADDVRQSRVDRREDNMLKITTDGRKAALDMRLVDPAAQYTFQSKVARCVENVADIYFKTNRDKSAQLIFCDTSTPKAGFNIYTELKQRLIAVGVPNSQIAFIHDAETEKKRSKLFASVRNGDVRVIIGSTFKLGLGVNIQDRLIALHHIDVPWRPADMTQREGRILRQGNTNPKVYIYRYITEGSFDAYSWQLLETKQRFISGLLSGSLTERSGSDIENTALDYAEVKALAIGNPLIKQRVEAANELSRYMTLQRKLVDSRMKMENELFELPGKIANQRINIKNCEADEQSYKAWKLQNPFTEDNKQKKEEAIKRKTLREELGNALREHVLEPKEKVFSQYCGFKIILPANMLKEKPFVWLARKGKYYVELGDTDVGNLIRIDKYLDALGEHLDRLNDGLARLESKETELKSELAKTESFTDEIEKYKQTIAALDKKLGVDNK